MVTADRTTTRLSRATAASEGRARMLDGLRERLLAWKARLLASPAFHRLAVRTPVSRGIARNEARALFDLCAGFVYTQVLRTFVELRVPFILAEGPLDIADLEARLGLSTDATRRLLVAAESLRLVVLTGERRHRVVLGDLGAALLANPGALAMIRHHALLYQDLADPVPLLRGEADGPTALRRFWAYGGPGQGTEAGGTLEPGACGAPLPEPGAGPLHAAAAGDALADPAGATGSSAGEADDYTALMAASQQLVADEVLDAWPFGRHRHVMDVGGGNGTFCLAAAARHPHLRLSLFDLPPVAARARERFRSAGLSGIL